jgi:hypothetical protein
MNRPPAGPSSFEARKGAHLRMTDKASNSLTFSPNAAFPIPSKTLYGAARFVIGEG